MFYLSSKSWIFKFDLWKCANRTCKIYDPCRRCHIIHFLSYCFLVLLRKCQIPASWRAGLGYDFIFEMRGCSLLCSLFIRGEGIRREGIKLLIFFSALFVGLWVEEQKNEIQGPPRISSCKMFSLRENVTRQDIYSILAQVKTKKVT